MSQKIRIRLKAFDHKTLDQSAEKIVDTVKEKFDVTLKQEPEILPIEEATNTPYSSKSTESDLDLSTLQ